jgi:hypothetical protein
MYVVRRPLPDADRRSAASAAFVASEAPQGALGGLSAAEGGWRASR